MLFNTNTNLLFYQNVRFLLPNLTEKIPNATLWVQPEKDLFEPEIQPNLLENFSHCKIPKNSGFQLLMIKIFQKI